PADPGGRCLVVVDDGRPASGQRDGDDEAKGGSVEHARPPATDVPAGIGAIPRTSTSLCQAAPAGPSAMSGEELVAERAPRAAEIDPARHLLAVEADERAL